MTTKCQGSVHLWLFLLVMTFAGLASLTLLSLNAAKGNSTPLETGFGGRFDKLLGVNSDGSGRHARSFPWDPDPRDDNTNPDEPNPRILIRVPRRDTLWETLFGRAFGRRDGSDTARNTAPRPQALTNDTVIQHPKARSKRAPRRMRHRPRKHHRSRARKQYVVNGKVYGQKARLEEGATEPPPRVIDRLQHMRRRFRKPKKQRHQRRKKKKGKRKKKKKKKAKKSRKQLLNEMIKRQKAKKKSKPNFRGRASAKYARHQKRFRSKKMKRKRYRPATYRVAVRKPKKEPWKQRRKWTPKVIKRRKQRRRRPIKEGYRRRKQKKRKTERQGPGVCKACKAFPVQKEEKKTLPSHHIPSRGSQAEKGTLEKEKEVDTEGDQAKETTAKEKETTAKETDQAEETTAKKDETTAKEIDQAEETTANETDQAGTTRSTPETKEAIFHEEVKRRRLYARRRKG
ncbi:uncharacterized protein DDB_G0286299-like isoform X2 [Patiria miniata]|uniref:Uncharacterized protein n=1 Tax=Patiria miniata TaxID=46514 RepID=A0A913ZNB8_PATMI|nr:uncharacterized protein DDB_G0286299-like isoform X2 [Patiria miniata]